MTFYESIFLRQFSMKLLGLLTTKHIFSFILGCPHDFNFDRPFLYGWVETGLNGQNGWANSKSCRHFRAKLKHVLWLGDLKASLSNSSEKLIYKTSFNIPHLSQQISCFSWNLLPGWNSNWIRPRTWPTSFQSDITPPPEWFSVDKVGDKVFNSWHTNSQ